MPVSGAVGTFFSPQQLFTAFVTLGMSLITWIASCVLPASLSFFFIFGEEMYQFREDDYIVFFHSVSRL